MVCGIRQGGERVLNEVNQLCTHAWYWQTQTVVASRSSPPPRPPLQLYFLVFNYLARCLFNLAQALEIMLHRLDVKKNVVLIQEWISSNLRLGGLFYGFLYQVLLLEFHSVKMRPKSAWSMICIKPLHPYQLHMQEQEVRTVVGFLFICLFVLKREKIFYPKQ